MIKTVEAMLAKGRAIAATVLEAAESDIEYRNGRFNVVGTDRAISLFDVAARAKEMKKRSEIGEDLDTKTSAETPKPHDPASTLAKPRFAGDPPSGNHGKGLNLI